MTRNALARFRSGLAAATAGRGLLAIAARRRAGVRAAGVGAGRRAAARVREGRLAPRRQAPRLDRLTPRAPYLGARALRGDRDVVERHRRTTRRVAVAPATRQDQG